MNSRGLPVYEGLFAREIEAHLELQRRNSRLEVAMPISGYVESFAAAFADDAVASRTVATEIPAVDPPTQNLAGTAAAWDDPDSWWNVREPLADWAY